MSGSNTICDDSGPPLADIVLFRLSFQASPQGFKTRLLGKDFHAFIKSVSFSSPTNVGLWDLTKDVAVDQFIKLDMSDTRHTFELKLVDFTD